MSDYGNPNYQENRYAESEGKTFDWLENYSAIKPFIEERFSDCDIKTINLGCGNGEFHEEMYDDGYKNIVNIDISEVVIEQMRVRSTERPGMDFAVGDVMDIKYPDNTFDLAIDKSTIDALLCGENAFVNVAKMTKEVQRVLKPGGVYMAISYGSPDSRNYHFERKHLTWDFKEQPIPSSCASIHYIYI